MGKLLTDHKKVSFCRCQDKKKVSKKKIRMKTQMRSKKRKKSTKIQIGSITWIHIAIKWLESCASSSYASLYFLACCLLRPSQTTKWRKNMRHHLLLSMSYCVDSSAQSSCIFLWLMNLIKPLYLWSMPWTTPGNSIRGLMLTVLEWLNWQSLFSWSLSILLSYWRTSPYKMSLWTS